MHSGERNFLNALLVHQINFIDDVLLAAATFGTPCDSHNTIGATVATTVLDFNKATVTTTLQQCIL